jgi:hypothetical protein
VFSVYDYDSHVGLVRSVCMTMTLHVGLVCSGCMLKTPSVSVGRNSNCPFIFGSGCMLSFL